MKINLEVGSKQEQEQWETESHGTFSRDNDLVKPDSFSISVLPGVELEKAEEEVLPIGRIRF